MMKLKPMKSPSTPPQSATREPKEKASSSLITWIESLPNDGARLETGRGYLDFSMICNRKRGHRVDVLIAWYREHYKLSPCTPWRCKVWDILCLPWVDQSSCRRVSISPCPTLSEETSCHRQEASSHCPHCPYHHLAVWSREAHNLPFLWGSFGHTGHNCTLGLACMGCEAGPAFHVLLPGIKSILPHHHHHPSTIVSSSYLQKKSDMSSHWLQSYNSSGYFSGFFSKW